MLASRLKINNPYYYGFFNDVMTYIGKSNDKFVFEDVCRNRKALNRFEVWFHISKIN